MNAIANLLQSTCRAIGFGSEIIGYTVSFGRSLITPKAVLAARLQPQSETRIDWDFARGL